MRIDKVGRNRKKLKEKSTPVIFRMDNETLLKLCDKFGIEYDRNAEELDKEVKNRLIVEIKKIIIEFVK